MDGWISTCVDEQMNGWVEGKYKMDSCLDIWMKRQIGRRVDTGMDKCMCGWLER